MKRCVNVGGVQIGGAARVSIQSMTNTDTRDVKSTVEQIKRLEDAGCEIIRCAVPDMEAAYALAEIKKKIKIPLVADIHFDYRLALEAIRAGVDKIRINPGNIGSRDRVKAVADACRERGIPIRIGVNGGSLEKELLEKYGVNTCVYGHLHGEGLRTAFNGEKNGVKYACTSCDGLGFRLLELTEV